METSMGSIQKEHRAPIPPIFEPQGLQNRSQKYHPDTKSLNQRFPTKNPTLDFNHIKATQVQKKAKQKM